MILLQRLRDLLHGGTVDAPDESESQLSSFVAELDDEIARLQRTVASAGAEEQRLKGRIDDLLAKATAWERRALVALEERDESFARHAAAAQEECELQSLALQQAWRTQRDATERLKTSLRGARARVAEAKTRYALLETQRRSVATTELMARLRERIQLLEVEAEAAAALERGRIGRSLDALFGKAEPPLPLAARVVDLRPALPALRTGSR